MMMSAGTAVTLGVRYCDTMEVCWSSSLVLAQSSPNPWDFLSDGDRAASFVSHKPLSPPAYPNSREGRGIADGLNSRWSMSGPVMLHDGTPIKIPQDRVQRASRLRNTSWCGEGGTLERNQSLPTPCPCTSPMWLSLGGVSLQKLWTPLCDQCVSMA